MCSCNRTEPSFPYGPGIDAKETYDARDQACATPADLEIERLNRALAASQDNCHRIARDFAQLRAEVQEMNKVEASRRGKGPILNPLPIFESAQSLFRAIYRLVDNPLIRENVGVEMKRLEEGIQDWR